MKTTFEDKINKEYFIRFVDLVNPTVSRKIPQEKINKIVELTKQGLFRKQIANSVHVNAWTVWKYQKENNLV